MITVVDRSNGLVVQKVSKPDGKIVRYQICAEANLGDFSQVVAYSTLAEARAAVGKSQGGKPLSHKEAAEAVFQTA